MSTQEGWPQGRITQTDAAFRRAEQRQGEFHRRDRTPLDENENLHEQGLQRLLERQWSARYFGRSGRRNDGGDAASARRYLSRARRAKHRDNARTRGSARRVWRYFARENAREIEFLNDHSVDGVVVLSPYFLPFSQEELLDYYRSLADLSRHPLYLYEIPSRTGVELEHATVERLAEHPTFADKVFSRVGVDRRVDPPDGRSIPHHRRAVRPTRLASEAGRNGTP